MKERPPCPAVEKIQTALEAPKILQSIKRCEDKETKIKGILDLELNEFLEETWRL